MIPKQLLTVTFTVVSVTFVVCLTNFILFCLEIHCTQKELEPIRCKFVYRHSSFQSRKKPKCITIHWKRMWLGRLGLMSILSHILSDFLTICLNCENNTAEGISIEFVNLTDSTHYSITLWIFNQKCINISWYGSVLPNRVQAF